MNDNDSRRILVAVDGSDSSIEALRRAALIATAIDAPIEAVTTWEYPALLESYYPLEGWSPEEDARQILSTAVEKAFHGSPPMRLSTKTLHGPAARTLIDESQDAFMLVLGSRGHGGFAGLLLGSVSTTCAQHAHCPVLIMHGPASAADVPAA